MKSGSDEPPLLPVTPVPLKGKKDVEGYQVMLTSSVEPENVVTVVIEMMLISSVVPFPKEISQVERLSCTCSLSQLLAYNTTTAALHRMCEGALYKLMCFMSLRMINEVVLVIPAPLLLPWQPSTE